MRLVHLSDLHLGKRVYEYSMLEDQRYILQEILEIIDEEKPDGVLLAGDIYDKQMPSIEAVRLFDYFLEQLVQRKQKVFIIGGNHDSIDRISFASPLLQKSEVYIARAYDGKTKPIVLEDDYGSCNLYLLPFVKPVQVAQLFPEEKIKSYTDAVGVAIRQMQMDYSKRNILVMHQYVAGASRCESEETSIGGLDDVSADVLCGIDYVAMGHIHNPQKVGKETVRYCGTPLKYSFSEVHHQKSVTIVELREKKNVEIHTIPLNPLRDFYEIRGTYEELTARSYYEGKPFWQGYLRVILTDEEDVPEAMGKLRAIYPYIMRMEYDNRRTRTVSEIGVSEQIEEKTPRQLFDELFQMQNGGEMSEEQGALVDDLIEQIWGGTA